MILIDNYDSFTYNIAQAFQMLGERVEVIRNNTLSVEALLAKKPSSFVIGPGPGAPSGAGISKELIRKSPVPLLGICLGHQAIGEVFGADVVRANQVMHGKPSSIYHHGADLFKGLPTPFEAIRYHSLVVENLPAELQVTAWTKEGEILALQHKAAQLYGVQFHPESVGTENGWKVLKNFLDLIKIPS